MVPVRIRGNDSIKFRPSRVRALTGAALLAVLTLLSPVGGLAQSVSSREYQLKAAFLFNFIKFVEWPAQQLPASSPNLQVCVAGREAHQAALATIQGKVVKGKTIVVTQFTGPQDLANCHVLFVSSTEKARVKGILEGSRNSGVLTVGEVEGFARSGGIINFTSEGNKIRFEINPTAAEQARLSISSQLLKLAKVVRS